MSSRPSPPVYMAVRTGWTDRWGLIFIETWIVFTAAFALLASLYVLRDEPDWWTRNWALLAAVLSVPVQGIAYALFFYWFEGRRVATIRLDDTGISVKTRRGESWSVAWERQGGRIQIFSRGVGTESPHTVIVWAGLLLLPATRVSESSALALIAEARLRSLVVSEREYGWGRWRKRSTRIRLGSGPQSN